MSSFDLKRIILFLLMSCRCVVSADEAIADLFDGSVNPQDMIRRLDALIVERDNRKVLLKLYNNRRMNRSGFRHFVETCGE